MEMEDVRILALRAAGALSKSARRILYPFSHDCICKGEGMRERREPPCLPASQVTLIGRLEMASECSVCLREESIYLPCTYIASTSWSSLRSLICLPTHHYSAPPTLSIFVLILQSLFAPLCISFGFSWQNEGRTDAADADGPPKHESARGVPAAARFGNEFGPLDVAFPSLSLVFRV